MTDRTERADSANTATPPEAGDLSALPALISDIVETMRKGDLERLEVQHGDFHLSLRSYPRTRKGSSSGTVVSSDGGDDSDDARTHEPDHHVVTSPMIGTFYAAPAPGEAAFVQPGDQIEAGQVIGIVEAMKIMNEIVADRSGMVLEVLAEDGETVEYGSPLVRLSTSA